MKALSYHFTFTSHSFDHGLAKLVQIQSPAAIFISFLKTR